MSSLGTGYSVWKSKFTLGLFMLLALLQVGPRFVDIPGVITLISLPVTMIHSMTFGKLLGSLSFSFPYMNTIALLFTTYIFSAILGYIIHSQSSSTI